MRRTSGVARVVFGDSLSSFRDGVLSKLSWENETDSSLNFSGSDGMSLVVASETTSFSSNSLKDIINEVVHNDHGLSVSEIRK